MSDDRWSPFDPGWYQSAFDKFISTAEELFNQNDIIEQGYVVPDADGSKSSIFRRDAILNNSFNESLLRETLKDIYLNSSHKLVASNHDNVHFFHWDGTMDDVTCIPNTSYAELQIPTEQLIAPDMRTKFKRSQFFRKWISITDLSRNWDVFKWMMLLFINQRIYSEYSIRIDDQVATIRFKYEQFWVDKHLPVYIYKFDTMYQTRIKIAAESVANPDRWNWTVPMLTWYGEGKIFNYKKVVVAFNRIADPDERKDGRTNVDALGDNLEFLPVDDTSAIDLTRISDFNKGLLLYEDNEGRRAPVDEWIWMTIFVPKFMHEYPIPLAVDTVYRPYYGKYSKVWAIYNGEYRVVRTEESPGVPKYVNISMDNKGYDYDDGWKRIVRPLVLADSFDTQETNPYISIAEDVHTIGDLSDAAHAVIDGIKDLLMQYDKDVADGNNPVFPTEEFESLCDQIEPTMVALHDEYINYTVKHDIDEETDFDVVLQEFLDMVPIAKAEGHDYPGFYNDESIDDGFFWKEADNVFSYSKHVDDIDKVLDQLEDFNDMSNPFSTWEAHRVDELRFRRPVDPEDFWMFEYVPDRKVWRPTILHIDRKFPDVYLLDIEAGEDENGDPIYVVPEENKIYKAMFFYSDTMNVNKRTGDIVRATPSWDDDMTEYMYNRGATYRDIFMEKFYWMGVRSIYKGRLGTQYRWEVIEYIDDNKSYDRFNQLFIKTLDPYFKMGLATYLKNDNGDYGFPFDYAIAKMEESLEDEKQKFLGYQKVTNFEMYLGKTWKQSYFDFITKILDDYDWSEHLVRRPGTTFDITRLLTKVYNEADAISQSVDTLVESVTNSIDEIKTNGYLFPIEHLEELNSTATEIATNINGVVEFIQNLDRSIYSLEDINHIASELQEHLDMLDGIGNLFEEVYADATYNSVYQRKLDVLNDMTTSIADLKDAITAVYAAPITFDIDQFMKDVNDPAFFDTDTHDGDNSLIGLINQFTYPWTEEIRELRNRLYSSTVALWTYYGDYGAYTEADIEAIMNADIFNFCLELGDLQLDDTLPGAYNLQIVNGELILNYQGVEGDDELSEYSFNVSSNNRLMMRIASVIISNRMQDALEDLNNLSNAIYKFWGDPASYDPDITNAINTSVNELTLAISETDARFDEVAKVFDKTRVISREVKSLEAIGLTDMEKWYAETMNNLITGINERIVYIDITSQQPDIDLLVDNVDVIYDDWVQFVSNEKYTFESVISYSKPPVQFIDEMNSYTEEIEAIINCINNYNREFVPDKELPTYSNTYKVREIELIDGGFGHQVGELVYIPDVGIYQIESVHGNLNAVKTMTAISTPKMFRDPKSDEKVYYGITNGTGMGIIVKVVDTVSYDIIDDSASDKYVAKAESIVRLIERNITTINPYNNTSMQDVIQKINNLNLEWDQLVDLYGNYMSTARKDGIGNILTGLTNITEYLTQLVGYRDQIDIPSIIRNLNELITRSRYIFEEQQLITPDYVTHETKLKEDIASLTAYYGNGTEWNDSVVLDNIITDIDGDIDSFITDILDIYLPTGSERDELDSIIHNINEYNDAATESLLEIPGVLVNINNQISVINDAILYVPEDEIDEVYKIASSSVAVGGTGYTSSSIVSIPEYDDIHLIITDAEDGRAVRIRPLVQYALTERFSGSEECDTKTGEGSGLIVGINGVQITKDDSVYFRDPISDRIIPDQFDDNDMMKFRFENIHDLPIFYEVFYGGKQVIDFITRHELQRDTGDVIDYDSVYLNANDVMNLQNSAVDNKNQYYFIYKLDDIEIVDPGAGYYEGQEIVVATEQVPLKLKVTKVSKPLGGIEAVDIVEDSTVFNGSDPAAENAGTVPDTMNNIDDEYSEGYYDHLTSEGIVKSISRVLPIQDYYFIAKRFDNLDDGLRNKNYMHGTVDLPTNTSEGDPDDHYYLGSRIDNSQVPYSDDHIWDGILPIIPHMDPFVPDADRIPAGLTQMGEYQFMAQINIHNSDPIALDPDITVQTHADLPKYLDDWEGIDFGSTALVLSDEKHHFHKMLYTVHSFTVNGWILYDDPVPVDNTWNQFIISWNDDNYYPDIPTLKAQYPDADYTVETYSDVLRQIDAKEVEQKYRPRKFPGTYIHNITKNDVSVYNHTLHQWENLNTEKWTLNQIDGGFSLVYSEEGEYSYEMSLYLNKIPDTQMRNAEIKRSAKFNVSSYIYDEVDTMRKLIRVNVGRDLRIRKMMPFEQKETYTLSDTDGYEMHFKVANYMHFVNELHLEDVNIYNKTVGRYENIFDQNMFEVMFKDNKYATISYENLPEIDTDGDLEIIIPDGEDPSVDLYIDEDGYLILTMDEDVRSSLEGYRFNIENDELIFIPLSIGYETQTKITQAVITNPGEGFSNGFVWGINKETGAQIFGEVTADFMGDGHMLTFTPLHCPNMPETNLTLEFQIYQYAVQWNTKVGRVIVDFRTEKLEVAEDGYIHNVINTMAPLSREFIVKCLYHLDSPCEYELRINKNPQSWEFVRDEWEVFPTFTLPGVHIPQDRLYIVTSKGRIPLVNPSTGKPAMIVSYTDNDTEVIYLNLYNKYEHIQIHASPYPMRSVYIQRRVPDNGYIDLQGKINKPLDKKYFEFWMNGRLLSDEVTIISPTKLFLHGLKSLRNFEIIEINRTVSEYFSDSFLELEDSSYRRPYPKWNFNTYIDDALEGNLSGDNFTTDEQEALLGPVWSQVPVDDPDYKNYPQNADTENDILLRVDDYADMSGIDYIPYQFSVINVPTIESVPVSSRSTRFEDFGFVPITDEEITAMLDEEWKEEIENGEINPHSIISDDEWFGVVTRLYDEYGMLVHNLNDSAYQITDDDQIRINSTNRIAGMVNVPPSAMIRDLS